MKDLYNKMKNIKIKGSLFFTIIALVSVVYGALSIRIMKGSFSVVENNGIEIRIPSKVLLGAPTNYEQYRGSVVYNWDDFQIKIYNDSEYTMTDISLNLDGTGTVSGDDGGSQGFEVNNLPSTLSAGDNVTVRGYGAIAAADNWTDTDQDLTISYKLNGESFSTTQNIHFYSYKTVNYASLAQPTAIAGEYRYAYYEGDFEIRLERTNIYIEKSESLDNLGVQLKYKSTFNSTVKVEHPQSNTTDGYFSSYQPRLKDYFYIQSKPGNGSNREITTDGNWQDIGHVLRGDYATQTTNGIVEVQVPVRATYSKGLWSKSTNDSAFEKVTSPVVNLSIYDKSGLYDLIYQAQAHLDTFDSEYYNVDTAQGHIDEAVRIYNTRVTTQPEIDAIKTQLNSDILTSPSEKNADYTQLGNELSGLDENLYTPATWSAFVTTYNESKDMYENRPYYKKDQREIDKQVKKLIAEKSKLIYKDANYDNLTAAITAAQAKRDTQQTIRNVLTYIYTDNSRQNLTDKIGEVVYGLDITKQSQVDGYQTVIESYADALALKDANYDLVNTAVNAAIVKRSTMYGSQTLYTDETIALVNEKINAVQSGKKITEQSTVDGWADDINGITWVKRRADYTAVDAALAAAIQERNKTVTVRGNQVNQYTSASQEAFDLKIAEIDDNISIDEQATVDGYIDIIDDALDLLEKAPADYNDINSLIDTITTELARKYEVEFIYTSQTITTMNSLINSVTFGLTIESQDAIDTKKDEIEAVWAEKVMNPAHYTAVEEAIAAATNKKNSTVTIKGNEEYLYTETTRTAVDTAIGNVVYNLYLDEQDRVLGFATAINAASDALTVRRAIYDDIDTYIQFVNEKIHEKTATNEFVYTIESRTVVEDAINAVPQNITINNQALLDGYQAAIEAAYEAKVKNSANYETLDSVIQRAGAKKNTKVTVRGEQVYLYTQASRDALQAQINLVQRDKKIDQQSEVDDYITAIEAAESALEKRTADYTDVNASIDLATTEITKLYKEQLIYTTDSIAVVQTAIEAVINNLTIERQDDIDTWKTNIDTAVSNLVLKRADYSQVTAAKNAAEAARDTTYTVRGEDVYIYTDTTRQAVTTAISGVIYELDITAQDQVTNYATTINNAVENLIEKDADYTELNAAISAAQEEMSRKIGGKFLYTDQSITAVNNAINNVVEGRKIRSQAEVDGWTTAINNAVEAKVEAGADYREFDTTVTEFHISDEYTNGWYVVESKEDVDNYINGIDRSVKISNQQQVDIYTQNLKDMIEVLPLYPADYTEVNALIDEYRGREAYINGWYKQETQQPLEDYIASYNKNLTINKQSDVTAIKNQLQTLINSLQIDNADYSEINEKINAFHEGKAYKNNWYTNPEIVDDYIATYNKNLPATQQADVDAILAELNTRLNQLEYKDADYTSIDNTATAANNISDETADGKELYTAASYSNLRQVLARYQSLARDLTRKNQEDIDEVENEIIEARNNLVKNDADYSKINKLVEEINKLNKDDYKNFNLVEEQLKNIIYGKKIDEQNLVDYMYDILNKAYKKLEKSNKKSTTSSNQNPIVKETKIVSIKVNGNNVDLTSTPFKHVVSANVNAVDIQVELSDDSLGYKVQGKNNLSVGENEYKIIVGNTEYKLIITREASSNYLKELKIKGHKINFRKKKESYKIKLKTLSKKLNITAIPEDDDTKVEIVGNENLVDGSTIRIVVTGQDEQERTYIINVQKDKKNKIIPIVLTGTIVAIFAVTGTVIKRKY